MKTNICTNKDQSARLLKCGVSVKSADMCWYIESGEINIEKLRLDTELIGCSYDDPKRHYEYIPAWSLNALLRLIPHVIEVYDDGDYYFSLAQEFPASEDYHAAYKYCWADDDVFVGKRSSCPIEACVQLIEWLVENNYKLNEQ